MSDKPSSSSEVMTNCFPAIGNAVHVTETDLQGMARLHCQARVCRYEAYATCILLQLSNGTETVMTRGLQCWAKYRSLLFKLNDREYQVFSDVVWADLPAIIVLSDPFQQDRLVYITNTLSTDKPFVVLDGFVEVQYEIALAYLCYQGPSGRLLATEPHIRSLLQLPNEVHLMIMQKLKYRELHAIRQVCRHFRSLAEYRDFDSVLYRSGQQINDLESSSIPEDDVAIHPIFNRISLWCRDVVDIYTCDNYEYLGLNKLADTPCWTQMATNPPMKMLWYKVVQIDVLPSGTLQNEKGVTVGDLINVINLRLNNEGVSTVMGYRNGFDSSLFEDFWKLRKDGSGVFVVEASFS